jgi:xanthine dehydrogenase YagT iron-sulfur-binding subunit
MQPIHHDSDVPPVAKTATSGIQLTINGQAYSVQVSPRRTLLDLLRDQLALTGTKKVCDMGHCGACTVLRDGTAVLSCLTMASACHEAEIVTVEGLAASDGTLSPLQQAFIDCDGFQCGFCTPGQLISATALLAENPTPSREEIQAYMAGNLCRCGAYSGIVDAIEQASRQG